MFKLVAVKFENSYRTYDYLCALEDVKRGDFVSVPTPRGEQEAEVVKVFWSDEENLDLPLYRYKYVSAKVDRLSQILYNGPREKRFVKVIFNKGSYEYSYGCEDLSIGEGDFVQVIARGEQKIAKVVEVYSSDTDNYRPIVRQATEQEVKEHIYSFVGEDFYYDKSAYDELKIKDGYHDYDLDEDDWIVLRYAELHLPEYKHNDFFRCYDTGIVKGDIVAVNTPLGVAEAVVRRVIYKLQKDFDEDWGAMGKVLYKVRDNPDSAKRWQNVQQDAEAREKAEARSEAGLNRGWDRVERNFEALHRDYSTYGGYAGGSTYGDYASIPDNVEYELVRPEPEEEGSSLDIYTSWEHRYNPLNIYYESAIGKNSVDRNRMTDEHGWMINGKWLAEHERNLSNPGSLYDSNGYLKTPHYEEALKDNFYLEEEEGYHGYDDPSSYEDEQESYQSYDSCDDHDDYED